jgi:type IV secretory pathway TrbL component
MFQKVYIELDDTKLFVKIGFQKYTIFLNEIESFRKFEYNSYDTFALKYKQKNKKKYLEFLTEKESAILDDFLHQLNQYASQFNLENESHDEALKIMKTQDTAKLTALVFIIVSFVVVSMFYWLVYLYEINVSLNILILLGLLPFAGIFVYFKRSSKQ